MKIFFYALREYDEQKYVEEFAKKYPFEYGFTSDYPSMENVGLAKGYDAIHFLRREMLDFTAFPVFFVSNLLLVQCKKYYFNRATVSRNCSIVL